MNYFERLVINMLTFVSMSVLLPNDWFYVSSLWVAFLASFVLSILNFFVNPILQFLSLPLTILTFGLFSFVINGLIIELTAYFVGEERFYVGSLAIAMLLSIILTVINSLMSKRVYRTK